ncbi:MAG: HNH endonuclease signature motif containing protein [Pseudomonadota bacterium]
MMRKEFTVATQQFALHRQQFCCALCRTFITKLGEMGRLQHKYSEIAHAHHILHAKYGGTNTADNCVILCQSCHYSIHEGGNYRYGTVICHRKDFPYFYGNKNK